MGSADEKAALHAVARPSLLVVTRARSLPVMLGPVLAGSAASWAASGRFSWQAFLLVFGGASLGIMAFNVFQDAFDEASGATSAARADMLSVPTASEAISQAYPRARALRLASTLLVASAGCGGALAAWRDLSVLPLGAAAFAVAFFAVAPPARYGSRVPGSAEAGAVVAAMLQSAAAFAAQTAHVTAEGLRIGIVPGLLVAGVVYHQQFLRYRADLAIGHSGTVARLGPHKGVAVSAVMILAPYVTLAVQVALGVWPPLALLALLALVPVVPAWLRLRSEIGPLDNYLAVFGASLGGAAVANVLLVLSLAAG